MEQRHGWTTRTKEDMKSLGDLISGLGEQTPGLCSLLNKHDAFVFHAAGANNQPDPVSPKQTPPRYLYEVGIK